VSGRSAAWLARLVRDQEVGGSNPLAPTNLFKNLSLSLTVSSTAIVAVFVVTQKPIPHI
jgi:hypothetical protein